LAIAISKENNFYFNDLLVIISNLYLMDIWQLLDSLTTSHLLKLLPIVTPINILIPSYKVPYFVILISYIMCVSGFYIVFEMLHRLESRWDAQMYTEMHRTTTLFSHLKFFVLIMIFINKTNISVTSVCAPITYFSFCFRNLTLSENSG